MNITLYALVKTCFMHPLSSRYLTQAQWLPSFPLSQSFFSPFDRYRIFAYIQASRYGMGGSEANSNDNKKLGLLYILFSSAFNSSPRGYHGDLQVSRICTSHFQLDADSCTDIIDCGVCRQFRRHPHRVHIEFQWPFSGVHYIMIIMMVNQPSLVRGEGLQSRAKLRCTLQLRGQMHSPYYSSTPIFTLWSPPKHPPPPHRRPDDYTARKISCMYSFFGNSTTSVPISRFMCL